MTKVDLWLRKNKLSLSYNKSSYMIIRNRLSKKNALNLTISNNVISQSNTGKISWCDFRQQSHLILDNKLIIIIIYVLISKSLVRI